MDKRRPKRAKVASPADAGPSTAAADRADAIEDIGRAPAEPPFPLEELPRELLARVLEMAGSRVAWRLRRVCRSWREAAEGIDWSPFELEVCGDDAAEDLEALARGGRLAIRGEIHLRVLLESRSQSAALLAALAAGGPWKLRAVEVYGAHRRCQPRFRRAERALGPMADLGDLRSLAMGLRKPAMEVAATGGLPLVVDLSVLLRWLTDSITRMPRKPPLERLLLDVPETCNWELIARLLAAVGGTLRELHAEGLGPQDFLHCPRLEQLHSPFQAASAADVRALLGGLPRLKALRLECERPDALAGVAAALEGGAAPALADLDVDLAAAHPADGGAGACAAALERLAAAGGGRLVRELRLYLGGLRSGAATFAAVARLPRLRRLRVSGSLEAEADLASCGPLAALPPLPGGLRIDLHIRGAALDADRCRALGAAATAALARFLPLAAAVVHIS